MSSGHAAAPTSAIAYNGTFQLTVQSSEPTVGKVTLIRLGATTHGFDQGQRFINCNFTGTTTLTVTSPKNNAIAPPGWYMVFAVSTSGVPSHARYVQFTN